MAEAADIPRTGPSAARRWLGRGAALLAGTALLGGLLNPAAAQAAGALQAPAADGKARTAQPVSVSLDSFAPAAPVKGDRLTITGTVTNQSKRTITEAHVGLRVGPVLNGRSAIDHAARRDGFSPGADGLEIDEEYAQEIDSLAAGRSLPFRLSVPVDDLDLDSNGIYQLGVSLSGQTAAQPYEQVQGIERTFLPWQPKAAAGRPRSPCCGRSSPPRTSPRRPTPTRSRRRSSRTTASPRRSPRAAAGADGRPRPGTRHHLGRRPGPARLSRRDARRLPGAQRGRHHPG
ncbi:DUF6049 family protein [Actinomadura keratinilytica]